MNSKTLASKTEEDLIARNVLIWLNTFPDLPVVVIEYEQLPAKEESMALSSIQGTYITAADVLGNYEAEYQFKIVYRIKPGNSNDRRMKADELLNRLGDWAARQLPELGEGVDPLRVEATSRASLFDAYENGYEDHQILMKLSYEVNRYG